MEDPAFESTPSAAFELERIPTETFIQFFECYEDLPSTNNRALHLAGITELPTPALILTEHQSAGRGRGENAWWSANGALTFSVILDAEESGLSPELWPQVSLATGLAICEALDPLLTHVSLKLKWPNDVMLGGKKLCGILSEIPPSSKGRIVVGIGINVNNRLASAPVDVQRRATSLADATDTAFELTEVLIRVLQHLETEFVQLAENGLKFLNRFRKRCWLSAREIAVDTDVAVIQGLCLGIDEEGGLLIQTQRGIERILSGTVTAIGS